VAKIADFGAAVFTCGIGKDKVSYGGTPHFQVRGMRLRDFICVLTVVVVMVNNLYSFLPGTRALSYRYAD
jgi:hypothetical protein